MWGVQAPTAIMSNWKMGSANHKDLSSAVEKFLGHSKDPESCSWDTLHREKTKRHPRHRPSISPFPSAWSHHREEGNPSECQMFSPTASLPFGQEAAVGTLGGLSVLL